LVGAAFAAALVGTAGSIALGGAAGTTPTEQQRCSQMRATVYERVNPTSQASLLTTARSEADEAGKRNGFTVNMGTPFRASTTPASGLTKVLRLRNSHNLDFFWTASTSEAQRAVSKYGYKLLGSSFYAATRPSGCEVPVYRYQHSGLHRYVVSAADRAKLAKAGWRAEGIAFYGAPAPASAPTPPSHPSSTVKASPSPSKTSSSTPSSPHPTSSAPSSTHTTTSSAGSKPPSSPPPSTGGGSGPLSRPLYVMPSGQPWSAYQSASDPTTKRELWQIAGTARAYWLGGASGDQAKVDQIESAAVSQGKTPTFVLYAIPHRDCGHYSAGGLSTTSQYESWVDSVRKGIGGRPAVVIVEPDAIGWGCLSSADQAARIAMMKYAIRTMSEDANTWVYVHAGSSGLSAQGIATSLKQIGIEYARGFAVNVSSYGHLVRDRLRQIDRRCPRHAEALRDRHVAQRPGPQPRQQRRSAELVQPARARRRLPAHDANRRPAGGRVPLDQDTRRLGR
jgi:hypothetical protein